MVNFQHDKIIMGGRGGKLCSKLLKTFKDDVSKANGAKT